MKITRLLKFGLIATGASAAVLPACSSGDESSPARVSAGSANTSAGTHGLPVASAGSASVPASGGAGSGAPATSGGVTQAAGTTSTGGTVGVGNHCTDLAPDKCSAGTSGTGSGGARGGGGGQPPVIEGGTPGWASRYWDCCKPACGWKGNVPAGKTPVPSCSAEDQSLGGNYDAKNACEGGGSAYMCHDFGPWKVSPTLAYGFAAVSMGNDYCGKCFQLQFTGSSHTAANDAGANALAGKTMIVQAINNGGVGSDQFDLLIPGGGVGDFDACSSQWGTSELGERYGGFYLACQKQNGFNHASSKACAAAKCQSVFANKPELLAGCNFFVNWFGAPDNPNLVFKEVDCPEAITDRSHLKR